MDRTQTTVALLVTLALAACSTAPKLEKLSVEDDEARYFTRVRISSTLREGSAPREERYETLRVRTVAEGGTISDRMERVRLRYVDPNEGYDFFMDTAGEAPTGPEDSFEQMLWSAQQTVLAAEPTLSSVTARRISGPPAQGTLSRGLELPEQPVSEGSTWSRETRSVDLPLLGAVDIATDFRHLGMTEVAGLPCHRIQATWRYPKGPAGKPDDTGEYCVSTDGRLLAEQVQYTISAELMGQRVSVEFEMRDRRLAEGEAPEWTPEAPRRKPAQLAASRLIGELGPTFERSSSHALAHPSKPLFAVAAGWQALVINTEGERVRTHTSECKLATLAWAGDDLVGACDQRYFEPKPIHLWRADARDPGSSFTPEVNVTAIAVAPRQGKPHLFAGDQRGGVRVYTLSGEQVARFVVFPERQDNPTEELFYRLDPSPDGRWLAVDSYEGVRVISTADGKDLTPSAIGGDTLIDGAAWVAADRLAASSRDTLLLFEIPSGKALGKPQPLEVGWNADIDLVVGSPAGHLMVAGEKVPSTFWTLSGDTLEPRAAPARTDLFDVAMTRDGTHLLLIAWDGYVGDVVPLDTLKSPRKAHHGPIAAHALSADGDTLVSLDERGQAILWDPATGTERGRKSRPKGHLYTILREGELLHADAWHDFMAVIADRRARVAASLDADGRPALWRLGDTPERVWTAPEKSACNLAMATEGRAFVVAWDYPDRRAEVRGTKTGRLLRELEVSSCSVAISGDGSRVAVTAPGSANQLRVVDVDSGTPLATFAEPAEELLMGFGVSSLDDRGERLAAVWQSKLHVYEVARKSGPAAFVSAPGDGFEGYAQVLLWRDDRIIARTEASTALRVWDLSRSASP